MPNFILITQSYRIIILSNSKLIETWLLRIEVDDQPWRVTTPISSKFVTIVIHWLEELACNSLSMVSRACSPSVLSIDEIHLINRTR